MDGASLQEKLGAAIRDRRTTLQMSQEAFADSIKMHRAYYSKIERGERNVTLVTLWRVARGLGLEPSQLLREAGI
jgi:transcriptional regulator with XRE-family HTH domain